MLRFIYRASPSKSAGGLLDVKLFLARDTGEETFQGSVSLSEIEWKALKKLMNVGDLPVTSKRTVLKIDGEDIHALLMVSDRY